MALAMLCPLACACPVIQVNVRDLHTGGQGGRVHREVMVLGADLNAPCESMRRDMR